MQILVFLLIALAVPLTMIIAGIAMTLRSNRTSKHHLCTTCGYDLRGLPTSDHCPECGVALDGSNTIVPGQTVIRRWQMAAGLSLLLFGLIGVSIGITVLMVILLLR